MWIETGKYHSYRLKLKEDVITFNRAQTVATCRSIVLRIFSEVEEQRASYFKKYKSLLLTSVRHQGVVRLVLLMQVLNSCSSWEKGNTQDLFSSNVEQPEEKVLIFKLSSWNSSSLWVKKNQTNRITPCSMCNCLINWDQLIKPQVSSLNWSEIDVDWKGLAIINKGISHVSEKEKISGNIILIDLFWTITT